MPTVKFLRGVNAKEIFGQLSERLKRLRQKPAAARSASWTRMTPPRLVLAWGDNQARGILFHCDQGQWSPRQLQTVSLSADATSLPSQWISLFTAASPDLETWLILPRQLISAQVVQLPSTQPSEIAEMLRLQLRKLTPYAPQEVMTSHMVLEKTPEGYSQVLLLAVRWEVLSQTVGVATASGVDPIHVMTSTEAVSRWISMQMPNPIQGDARAAVLDIDNSLSEFMVMSRHGCEFTRAIPIGWNRLAEESDRWIEKLVHEIQISLDLYRHGEVSRDRSPDQLLLLGSSPLTALLGSRLSVLDMAVRVIDPIAGVPADVARPEQGSVSWTALLGAGLQTAPPHADFTPPELLLRQSIRERGHEIARLGILAVAVMMVLSGIVTEKIVIGSQQLKRLQQAIAAIAPEASELEKSLMRIRLIQQRSTQEASTLRILDRIYRATPGNVTLTSIRFESGKEVEVKGYSGNMSQIFEFVSALEKVQFFPAVKTKSVAKRRFGNQELTDFEVVCQLAGASTAAPAAAEEKPKSWMVR